MTFLLLIVVFAMALFLSYRLFNREIMAPPVVVCAMFLFCSLVAMTRFSDWNIDEFAPSSALLLACGLIALVVGSLLAQALQGEATATIFTPVKREQITVPPILIAALIVIGVVVLLSYYQSIASIVAAYGANASDVAHVVNSFRALGSTQNYMAQHLVPSYVRYLGYALAASASVFLFFVIHNACFGVTNRWQTAGMLCVIALWVGYMLLQSNRGSLLLLLAEAAYLLYFFWGMSSGAQARANRRVLRWGLTAFVVFIAAFSVLTVLLGRRGSFEEFSLFDYVSLYIGTGVRSFDLFVQEPVQNEHLGQETFASLYKSLFLQLGLGDYTKGPLEFRQINGANVGNIYTAFRRYYSDFGVAGLVAVPTALGFGFMWGYSRIQAQCAAGNATFGMLLFAYLSRELFYMPIDDVLLTYDFAPNLLVRVLLMYLLFAAVMHSPKNTPTDVAHENELLRQ